jgi:superfamily II DNA helicase RecQ
LCEITSCRRQTLLAYFGESEHAPCGNCDTCLEPVPVWDGTTQHYADFEVQVGALLGRRQLAAKDYDEAAEMIVRMVLRSCGLRYRSPK